MPARLVKSARASPRRARRGDRGRRAVIDIGSNSIRLVVYENGARAPLQLFNEKVLCGLGRGLAATGNLAPEGVGMALANLARFKSLIAAMGARAVEVVATAAVRDARNGAAFVADVTRRTGFKVRILSGADEARLSALGVLSGIPDAFGVTGDLGGGSLELTELDNGRIGRHVTLPLGPLRLMDQADGNLRRGRAIVERHLDGLGWLRNLRGRSFYAVGGAWRQLARILMDHQRYPLHIIHNYRVTAAEAKLFLDRFEKLDRDELKKLANVSRRRGDTLPWAALVMNRLFEIAPPRDLVFSAFGLREGCLFDQLSARDQAKDPLIAGCQAIAEGGRFASSADELFSFIAPLVRGGAPPAPPARLVRAACLLSDIAWTDHPDYRAEHGFQRVLTLPLVGVDHSGRGFLAVAIAARYGGDLQGDRVATARALLDPATLRAAQVVGLALRLGFTLSGGAPRVLAECGLKLHDDAVVLTLPASGSVVIGDAVLRRLDALARGLGFAPQIVCDEAVAAAE
ncbi:MAG TPA: Ppx/GppA family phosphatase [Candidatus Sulfotelmatobacter sp.]|nr:Ppx/GppA family phosphatase [Candidatus Sulfotelmatobacter sp.]